MAKKSGLGRGLDALYADNDTAAGNENGVMLRLSEIEPNRNQPRKDFDEQALSELADSIREHGVIQPLLVRPLGTGGYQLVAGGGPPGWWAWPRSPWSSGKCPKPKSWNLPSSRTSSART